MLLFRADGNARIGAGHIMRCLAIADAARDKGVESVFVLASDEMQGIIQAWNFKCLVMNTEYSEMDKEDIISLIQAYAPTAVIVDSYYVTDSYLTSIHKWCKDNGSCLVYIDDVEDFSYPCDILINYQIHSEKQDYYKLYDNKKIPNLLLGSDFAPLRKEFITRDLSEVKVDAKDIFVSTGGADPEHLALSLVKAVIPLEFNFHFVIGSMNRDKETLLSIAADAKNIYLHENVKDMSSLMRSCDIAISASGSTLYELCAMHIPTLTYVLADNQKPIAEAFHSKAIIRNCGDIRIMGGDKLSQSIIEAVMELANNYDERRRLAGVMAGIVDGLGAGRIANGLLNE